MEAANVTTTAQRLVANGPCNFVHIYNNSDVTIYVAYDGANVTVAAGIPIEPGQTLHLDNDGNRQIFIRGVSLIHGGTGNKEIRIQKG